MSSFKLKLNTKSIAVPPPPSIPSTPLTTPGGTKLKLKFAPKSTPSTPAVQLPPPPPPSVSVPANEPPKIKKTKAGRSSKPSAKVLESRKRLKEDSDDDEDEPALALSNPPKKIKLNVGGLSGSGGPLSATPKTPAGGLILKAKVKGKPPKRPPGEGYDSEASDREIDPHIEEQFILRMMPGDDCDYLRQAIADKKIGIPKSQGGADVQMKFFQADGRRGAIIIRSRIYATTVVDLPTIIEGMKSWDKRGWWKSADICQMLLVFAQVKKEDEAKTIDLPSMIDPVTFQYPHGITAPMHNARKRVFRKRISKTAIEAVEEAVEKLLQADEEAIESKFDMIDPDRHGSQAYSDAGTDDENAMYSQDEDAEGEEDDQGYFGNGHANHAGDYDDNASDDDLAKALEEELEAEMVAELEGGTPLSGAEVDSSIVAGTPMHEQGENVQEDEFDSGDESVEDEDEPALGAAVNDVDDERKQRQNQLDGAREDIRELERQLEQQLSNLTTQTNPLLKRRVEDNIRRIRTELDLKKSAIEDEDDGDA